MASKKWLFSLCLFLMFSALAPVYAATPSVAVWNPEKGTSETRFKIDLDYLDRVSQWLMDAGFEVARVTAEQINNENSFSAQKFDALMLPGDTFPRMNTQALQKYSDEGGVLVALGAGKVPFNIAIEKEADGRWTMSPKTPTFAWQSSDIYFKSLGMRYIYNPGKHDQGVINSATPLLKKYLPNAPDINQRLLSFWVVPIDVGGKPTEYYPLVRSCRYDGADVVPQLFITKCGRRLGIIAVNELFTHELNAKLWPLARETVVALARIAADLRSGTLSLSSEMKIDLPAGLPPPEPMRHRSVTGSIEPEGAKAIVRWGKFDGGSFELGEPVDTTVSIFLKDAKFPRALLPRTGVKLTVPASAQKAQYLRIRGAYSASGAGLKAAVGNDVVWNESFVYLDTSGQGNISAPNLIDVPAEFQRLVYLPPHGTGTLTISNPGEKTVYFDAVQIEERLVPAPQRIIGLGAGFDVMRTTKAPVISSEVSSQWTVMRALAATELAGAPEDSKRWEKLDALMEKYLSMRVPIELQLAGTPGWCAISAERYELGKKVGRPHTVPPDPQKYAEIVGHIIAKYGDRIDAYEIWNEPDIEQFYRGTNQEYIALFKTIALLIRRLDSTARIISGGMSAFHEGFVNNMIESGAMKIPDLIAFHPYAAKSPGWDVPFGQLEGSLMAHGIPTEIYCNESGFAWKNGEWFQPPPDYTPKIQAQLLNVALARLLANGLSKLNVFHSGGDNHHFGLIDEVGNPRPAFTVFADYLPLGQKAGRRLDISMTRIDGQPLQGTYASAASHEDGSITIVINPAESDSPTVPVLIRTPLLSRKATYKANVRVGGEATPVPVTVQRANSQMWCELNLDITTRTVLTLTMSS